MTKSAGFKLSLAILSLFLVPLVFNSCVLYGENGDTTPVVSIEETDPLSPESTKEGTEAVPETTVEETTNEENTSEETTAEETTIPETTAEETTLPETTEEETTLPEETETPWNLVLVNPWNPIPEGHTIELKTVSGNNQIDARCAEALELFLADCKAAGLTPYICSSYRTWEYQEGLFQKKVNSFISKGYSEEDARILAAKETAVPGTSEHQLGLAADILCVSRPWLDEGQADTATQKWLMANCHKYGFILRYPKGTTDITGIIYEPWHYRYVGVEIATEIMTRGITLEEDLAEREKSN